MQHQRICKGKKPTDLHYHKGRAHFIEQITPGVAQKDIWKRKCHQSRCRTIFGNGNDANRGAGRHLETEMVFNVAIGAFGFKKRV